METPINPAASLQAARIEFRDRLKPQLKAASEARTFKTTIEVYEGSLNTAIHDKELTPEVKQAAEFVIGNITARKTFVASLDTQDAQQREESIAREERRQAGVVFSWFAKHYGNADLLLSSSLEQGDDIQERLHLLMGRNLSHWIAANDSLAKPMRSDIQQKQLTEMAKLLHTHGKDFHQLRFHIPHAENSIFADVDELYTQANIEETLRINPQVASFETRDWIGRNAREARRGRKIYDTPYYQDMIDKLHFDGRKKNGLSGVLLYGPPGTGKTEILQEKNRQQGFKTRVINIHYYTNFEDLIASKAIQLGVDRGATVAQKLSASIDAFKQETPENFGKYIQNTFAQLKQEGKLGEKVTLGDFMASFVSTDVEPALLAKDTFTDSDWATIKDGFISRQSARLLRTSLDSQYQETLEDIVRGEVLLAIQNGERAVLDEIDKAGPNSLGGILTFLAESPGESITVGNTTELIPHWFTIDATSNSMELDEYLKNRFTLEQLGTPPIKDQLMIAAVRLSDDEGNILLTPYEQRQMAGFFIYMVPEINELLLRQGGTPIANRDIQGITSRLVDFGDMKRTHVSFEEATQTYLSQLALRTNNPKVTEGINKVLEKYITITQNKPYDFRDTQVVAATPGEENSRLDTLKRKRAEALRGIVDSPFITAINGLHEQVDPIHIPAMRQTSLTTEQRFLLQNALTTRSQRVSNRPDLKMLPIGFQLYRDTPDSIQISATPENEDTTHILLKAAVNPDKRIEATSADGRVMLLSSSEANGQSSIYINFADNVTGQLPQHLPPNTEVGIDASGQRVSILNKDTQELGIYSSTNGNQIGSIPNVRRFSLSEDGQFVLFENGDGNTQIQRIQTIAANAQPYAFLPGESWMFAGDDMVLQATSNENQEIGEIAEKAFVFV